jgi:hypothetical protein
MRNRWFDAGLGRFLSRDLNELNSEAYTYALNNPVDLVDPDGMVAVGFVEAAKKVLLGAASSIAVGAGVRWATGGETWNTEDVAIDAMVGAAFSGAGLTFTACRNYKYVARAMTATRQLRARTVTSIGRKVQKKAFAHVEVNGVSVGTSIAGDRALGTTIPHFGTSLFKSNLQKGIVNRTVNALRRLRGKATGNQGLLDAERKALEFLARNTPSSSDDVIRITVDNDPCRACRGALAEFQAMFPNVDIKLIGPLYYLDAFSTTSSISMGSLGGLRNLHSEDREDDE